MLLGINFHFLRMSNTCYHISRANCITKEWFVILLYIVYTLCGLLQIQMTMSYYFKLILVLQNFHYIYQIRKRTIIVSTDIIYETWKYHRKSMVLRKIIYTSAYANNLHWFKHTDELWISYYGISVFTYDISILHIPCHFWWHLWVLIYRPA